MTSGLFTVLGGIGLFLFGMKIMTEALREAAGTELRRLLARFTTSPLAGVATGAAATALVQSSSATTVMTIGFVGAGLLSFPQALGIIYGAHIGTTATGWLVTLLGFKLKLGTIALPVLFIASLTAVLGRGRTARVGQMLAGICLLFIGLEMMQDGLRGAEGLISPHLLPSGGVLAQVKLVLIGAAATLIMQSSSAGVAMTLVLLGGGAIGYFEAGAMVIGMNLGTTFTGVLASMGASGAMRQTAIGNLVFAAVTALFALPLLHLIVIVVPPATIAADPQTALVLFHTAFVCLGALVFLPVTAPFARLVQRMVPDRRDGLQLGLDRALLSDESAALDAAGSAADKVSSALFDALGRALHPAPDLRGLSALPARVSPALEELEQFLARIRIPEDKEQALQRYSALLHQADHMSRLLHRVSQKAVFSLLADDPALRRSALALGAGLRRWSNRPPGDGRPARLSATIASRARHHRRASLLREHTGPVSVPDMFRRTDAMRWVQRVASHAERITHYAAIAAPRATAPEKQIAQRA